MLQGSFDTVSLDEVLGFLASSSKTGVLRVSGDRGTGSVWVEDGQVVSAETTHGSNDPSLDEVIFELLRFSNGTFAFEFDETPPVGGAPADIEDLLTQANKLLVEWRGIELVVPGLDYRVTPAPTLPADQVTITEAEWTTILAMGSNSTVEEVTNSLSLGEVPSLRRLKGLIERKLVLLSAPPADLLEAETAMSTEVVDPDANPDTQTPEVIEPAAVHEQTAPESFYTEQSDFVSDVSPSPLDDPVLAHSAESPDDEVGELVVPGMSASSETSSHSMFGAAEPSDLPPSSRRLSARRGTVESSSTAVPPPAAHDVAPEPDAVAPVQQAKIVDNMSDPFAAVEDRPPMPPPPPMPASPNVAIAAPAGSSGAAVPPPPAPPSPAEIAKFGSSVEDASGIEDAKDEDGESLLMRYLQNEG